VILHKKAIRAMWGNKTAYIACIVLVGIGILIYECLGIASHSLVAAVESYYRQFRLADAFAIVKAIPKQDIDRLRSIPGVSDVAGRQTYDARVLGSDSQKIITLKLLSVDPELIDPLNGILIIGGDNISNENDILLNDAFFKAHGLTFGDSLNLVVNGSEQVFNVCGIAQSPDCLYVVKANDPIPDDEAFGVAYVSEKTLFAFTKTNSYNDVSFALSPGFTYDGVKAFLEDSLERYGLQALYPKEDQISYASIDNKNTSYVSLGRSLPFVFVFMSIVILYLMLKRVIELDRTQIGTLKGLGYSGYEIVGHYMIYGGLTGFAGGALGCLGGYYAAGAFLKLLGGMSYNLPNLAMDGVKANMARGMLIAIISGLLGSLAGTLSVLKLNPAEAMRPPAPRGKNRVSKFNFLSALLLNSRGNIAIRGVTRNKLRSAFVVIGIMFSFGLLTVMSSYVSMIDEMLTSQFTKVELYDGKLSFIQPVQYGQGVADVLSLPGVKQAEGMLEIPFEIKHGHLKKTGVITALAEESALYKVHDDNRGIDLTPKRNALIMSDSLAAELEVKKGDEVYLSSAFLKDDTKLVVSDIAVQSMGKNCYMEINSLAAMLGFDLPVSSVIFNADDMAYIKTALIDAKNIASIQDTASTIEHYRSMMAPFSSVLTFMVVMAALVAFAIIYNTSAISLSEQKREYTTLRVLGLQISETAEILKFENWTLCAIGMALGLPFARLMAIGISGLIDMDPFKFPSNTPMYAFFIGFAGCVAAVFFSNRSSIGNIKKFELAEVLKDIE